METAKDSLKKTSAMFTNSKSFQEICIPTNVCTLLEASFRDLISQEIDTKTPKSMEIEQSPNSPANSDETKLSKGSPANSPGLKDQRGQISASTIGDRFLPIRADYNGQLQLQEYTKPNTNPMTTKVISQPNYTEVLQTALFPTKSSQSVLQFQAKKQKQTSISSLHSSSPLRIRKQSSLPEKPFRILRANAFQDEIRTNLLEWCEDTETLAIGLASQVALWEMKPRYSAGQQPRLLTQIQTGIHPDQATITNIAPLSRGQLLAVGDSVGSLRALDLATGKIVQTFDDCQGAITAISATQESDSTFVVGTEEGQIAIHDTRTGGIVSVYSDNTQPVVSLSTLSGSSYFATGLGNGSVKIWNAGFQERPIFSYNGFNGSVKAMTWSPFQYGVILAGGLADQELFRIRPFINEEHKISRELRDSCLIFDGTTQLTKVLTNVDRREIITAHGGDKSNEIIFHDADKSSVKGRIKAHAARVLHLCQNKSGDSHVSGSGDLTIKFWRRSASQSRTSTFFEETNSLKLDSLR